MPERTRSLSLPEAIDRLMANDQVFVGIDFDGTLAPIVEHPDLAVPDERAIALLKGLTGVPRLSVAVVSGRARADLRARVGEIPGLTLIGEHGNDVGDTGPASDPAISQARSMIQALAGTLKGASIENKASSVTFHYRKLADTEAEQALNQIRQWLAEHDDVRSIEGKKVIELTTAKLNKGDAIQELAGGAAIIYIGDDTTDESVFEILGSDDVGVKVGDGPTAASHRVEDVSGVVTILEQIALASR